MAEVGRKQRKTSLDVGTVSVGVEHGAHRERVSEVVESRPASRRARFQTRKTHKLQERPVNIAVDQPGADGGDEERRRARRWVQAVSLTQVGAQGPQLLRCSTNDG